MLSTTPYRLYSQLSMSIRSCLIFITALVAVGAGKVPTLATINKREAARVAQAQHQITEHLKKFQENLEGLRTTVDFEAITV
jgi:hypothetical protein